MTIQMDDKNLELLSTYVALANTPSYLWRKLSETSTVQALFTRFAGSELEDSLREILSGPVLAERDITFAYCVLVAWLLQGPTVPTNAWRVPGIERLPLAAGLISGRSTSQTSTVRRVIPPRVAPSSTRSISRTTRVIEGDPQ
jgi:hypothetical protein